MKKCLLLLFFVPLFSFSQGRLVLIGGGGESNGGWSDAPYTWALDQSQNRKVAVIYYSTSTSWIPEYFMDLGASDTARFDIDNLTLANAQATYDSLMNYDVFFIKGGNQWDYYSTWENTKVEDAITDKFNQGGVIMGTSAGMAILSEYIFTAENGSVYPDEGLEDYNNPNITIENDFLNIFPNYIFDTHFVERGRLGRLLAFVKNIQIINVHGLGVDDRTAICINNSNIGTVMGSASITIIEGFVNLNKKYFQLIDGQEFDFNNFQVMNTTGAFQLNPPNQIEYQNYTNTLLVSGSDSLEHMDSFLTVLHNIQGLITDTIYIYTTNINQATNLENYLNNLGLPHYKTIDINTAVTVSAYNFSSPKKILFYSNNWNTLIDFLNNTTNGNILKSKLTDNTTITAFAGQDSKFVGTTFCKNIHDNVYGSYYGELEFVKGLNLIKSSIFMPNTYDAYTSSYYENTQSAINWGMMKDTLKYGVFLSYNGYLNIWQNGNSKYLTTKGTPAILFTNNGTEVDTTTSYVYSSQNFLRQITSFKELSINWNPNNWLTYWNSTITGIEHINMSKRKLLNITNVLGENTQEKTNTPLFYQYENSEVEKKIIID